MSAVGNTYLLNLLKNFNIIFNLNYAYLVTLKILHVFKKDMYHKVRVELLNEKRETEIVKPTVDLRRKNNVKNQRIYSLKQLHNNILGINSLVY